MKQNNSGGFLRGASFFAIGTLAGLLLAIGLHTLMAVTSGGSFETAYLLDLPSWLLGLLVGLLGFFYGLIGYYGLVRGMIWQVIGTLAGATVVTLIRLIQNLTSADKVSVWEPKAFGFTEPAWVFGAFIGAICFLAGVGAITDWYKWAMGESIPDHIEDQPGWQKYH